MQSEINFNHLKIHTTYSICEGAVKIDEIADYCKKYKIKAIGVCDSFNLCSALEFAEKISKVGTQPIIGSQLNLDYEGVIGKISLYAMNENGYKNLVKLSSKSYLDIDNLSSPHIKFSDLINYNEGIIILSGSQFDLIGKLFKVNKNEKIKTLLKEISTKFYNRVYLEIQRHDEQNEKNFENFILKISKELELPLIASQEVFYLQKEMFKAHDALICIGEKTYVDETQRKKFNNQHFLKNNEEVMKLYEDLPEAMINNNNFPQRFIFKPKKSSPVLPHIQSSKKSVEEELIFNAEEGLKNKMENFILKKNKKLRESSVKELYSKRLSHELNIIKNMKYSSYFLIVSDYIKWAKKNSIPVGPGRGSGAGSLVAYCLDITDLDPLEFDLIFERFLNPDRISMPDFDIDFCEEKRDKVFEYLKSKYKNGVAHIITFGKLKARMVLRDVGRVIGLPYGHVDKICKMIPFDPSRPLTLKESIEREPRFKEEIKKNKKVEELIELSLNLEGLNRNMATHAAGVVIAGEELSSQVPLYFDKSSNLSLPSTQFDMYSSENAGLVKFDLLGLKTLTVIDKTVKILKSKNIKLDITEIDLKDKKIFELLSTGETTGLFQLESTGMREAIKQMKPNKFDDIIALVALYRPGPMSNIPIYNECKNNQKKPDYIHPSIENILKPTYGIIIYQEQVMQIAQKLAGFTAGEADILRRAMGKKKRAELEKQKERFINGAVKNGIKKDLANYIFTKIEPFAEYGFNKSHAAAYALIAYQTAFLKTYYKEDFIAATMSTELTNTNKLREFVEELKRLNVQVVRPNINECYAEFKSKKNKIYYGLGAIKNVGFDAISNVVNERELNGKFKSIDDFISRVSPKDINKLQLEGLVKSGAFDEINTNRKQLLLSIPDIISATKNSFEEKSNNQESLFNNLENNLKNKIHLKNTQNWTKKELLLEEFKSLGFFISDHPINQFMKFLKPLNVVKYKEFIDSDKKEGLVAGTIMNVQEKKSSKGMPFAIIKFSDVDGEFELFIFSENLIKNRDNLKDAETIILNLQKDFSSNSQKPRTNIKDLYLVDDFIRKDILSAEIEITNDCNIDELKELLKDKGNTKIKLKVINNSKLLIFDLKNPRRFNAEKLQLLKSKSYIRKISI